MNEPQAIEAHDELRARLERDYDNPVARQWTALGLRRPAPRRLSDGSYIFVYPTQSFSSIFVTPQGEAYPLIGACAHIWLAYKERGESLGQPRSQERFLGSTRGGKYQNFEHGMTVWEGNPDLGYRVSYQEWQLPDGTEVVKCTGFVAFSDLRGFTLWSQNADPDMIKKTLLGIERCFHKAFARTWCTALFVKGTGDGMMIVSESDTSDPPRPNHAREFIRACCRFVQYVQDDQNQNLLAKLPIGIGADFGEFHRIFILGRRDYVGVPINNASKIQQCARNAVVISPTYATYLQEDLQPNDIDLSMISQELPGKGYQLDARLFLNKDNDEDIWQNSANYTADQTN